MTSLSSLSVFFLTHHFNGGYFQTGAIPVEISDDSGLVSRMKAAVQVDEVRSDVLSNRPSHRCILQSLSFGQLLRILFLAPGISIERKYVSTPSFRT